jgi:transcription initiation factor IIE alpha subunit
MDNNCYLCKEHDKPNSFLEELLLSDGDEVVILTPSYCPHCGKELNKNANIKRMTRKEYLDMED